MKRGNGRTSERGLEYFIFQSRWLMAPFYIALVFALLLLLYHFLVEFWHFASHVTGMAGPEVILAILGLIDLSFTGNLILIVIFSGYENFVSRIDIHDHEDRPAWMGTIDFSGLKLKLFASIVAITGIELLKAFLAIERPHPPSAQSLGWLIGIHLTFLVTTIGSAFTDWLTARSGPHGS